MGLPCPARTANERVGIAMELWNWLENYDVYQLIIARECCFQTICIYFLISVEVLSEVRLVKENTFVSVTHSIWGAK